MVGLGKIFGRSVKHFGGPEQFLKVWKKIRNVREKISEKCMEKNPGGQKFWQRGEGRFREILSCSPQNACCPSNAPPDSETWRRRCQPDIIILELGTNDLCHLSPEVVGSRIEELARFFRDELRVKVVVVCQVIDRKIPHSTAPDAAFNAKTAILRQYLCVVLENEAGIFLWEHRDFGSDVNLLSLDGVHCNSQGQYRLYRSYRGAILKARNKL